MDPLNLFSHPGVYTPSSRSMATSPYSPGSAYTVAGHLPPQALPYHQASAEDALQSALNDHHASVLFDLGLSPTAHSRNLADSLLFPGSVSGFSGPPQQPPFHHQHSLSNGSRRTEASHARRSAQSFAGLHDANAPSTANGHNTTTAAATSSSTNGLPAQNAFTHRRRPSLQPPGSATPQHSHAHPSHLTSPMAPFFIAGPDLITRPRGIFGYIPTVSTSSASVHSSPSHSRNSSRDSTSAHIQTHRSSRTSHNPQQLARHRERRRISLARRRQSMAEQITAATRAADAGLRLANGLFSLSSLQTLPLERALDMDDDHEDDDELDDSDFLDSDDVDDEVLERQVIQEFRGSLNTKMVASPSAIRSLESVKLSDIPEGDRTCVICYNDYGEECPEGHREAPLRLPNCKHIFGDHCIKKWFEDSDSCPYCRNKLPGHRKHYAIRGAPIIEMLQARGWDQSRPEAQAILRRIASGERLSMRYFVPPAPTSPESAERDSQPDGVDENGRRTRQRRSYASAEVLETTRQHGSTASFDSTPVRPRSTVTSRVATPRTASSPTATTPGQLRPSPQTPSLRSLTYGSPIVPGPSPDTVLSRATHRVILQPTSPSQAQANRQAAAALRAGMMMNPLNFFSNSLGGAPGSSAGSL